MSELKLKWDIIFILGACLTALIIWVGFTYMNDGEGDMAVVLQDGKELSRYSLSEDAVYVISYGEEYNLLMISNGEAFVSDADCPDGLCMKQRAVSKNGESIICLPHKLVIQIEAKEEGNLDAVTY